jgi:hypothetical protein
LFTCCSYGLLQQLQHGLRQLVGLVQHRGGRLVQDVERSLVAAVGSTMNGFNINKARDAVDERNEFVGVGADGERSFLSVALNESDGLGIGKVFENICRACRDVSAGYIFYLTIS